MFAMKDGSGALALFVALSFAVAGPLFADDKKPGTGVGGGTGGTGFTPGVVAPPPRDPGYPGLTPETPGTRNIVILVGGSPVGSPEDDYAKTIQANVGGALFNGTYTMDDLIAYIISEAKAGRKIGNIYVVGHIVNLPDNADIRAALGPDAPQSVDGWFGFLHFGQPADAPEVGRMGNLGNALIKKLDEALAKAGLKYSDVFAEGIRWVFRVCSTNRFMAALFDELAKRLPAGAVVISYDVAYVWITNKMLAGYVISSKKIMGEQEQGRVERKGKNQPPALPPPPAPTTPPPTATPPPTQPAPAPAPGPMDTPMASLDGGATSSSVYVTYEPDPPYVQEYIKQLNIEPFDEADQKYTVASPTPEPTTVPVATTTPLSTSDPMTTIQY